MLRSFIHMALMLIALIAVLSQPSTALAQEATEFEARSGPPSTSNFAGPDQDAGPDQEAAANNQPGGTNIPSADFDPGSDEPRDPSEIIAQFKELAPDDIRDEGLKTLALFESNISKLTDSILAMRKQHTWVINGMSEDKQTYYDIRDETFGLMKESYSTSLKLLEYMPHPNAARFAVTFIEHCTQRDVYNDKTYEGAAKLMDGGIRLRMVVLACARSAMQTGRFEIAERIYKQLSEEDLEDEIDQRFIGGFEIFKEQYEKEQELLDADPEDLPKVKFKTSRGEVVAELYINEAPSTVARFITLVESGFYDGLDFYQVIEHLLALTGDELGDGSGRPDRFIADEHGGENVRMPLRGSLVMAKMPKGDTGDFYQDSASTQFAILFLPFPPLIEKQTVFGRVIEGMDIVGEFRLNDPNKKKEKNAIILPPDRIIEAEMLNRPETLPEIKFIEMKQQGPAAMPRR